MVDKQGNPTQTSRRFKYGLNIAIAVIAATAIVVALNFLMDRAFRRLSEQSPRATEWVRYDLTATRRYSLSPQTLKVIGGLEHDYEIVTLFRDTSVYVRRVRDLVEEYGRYSSRITVEQLNPAIDVTQTDRFYREFRSRFEQQLQPLVDAIDSGRTALTGVGKNLAEFNELIKQAIEDPALTNETTRQAIGKVFAALQRLETDIGAINTQFERELDQPLPAYDPIRSELAAYLSQIDEGILTGAIGRFEHVNKVSDTPDAVKDKLLRAIEQMRATRETAREALSALQFAEPVRRYEETRATLDQESIAILGPEQVRVIPIQEMYRAIPEDRVNQTGERELGFIGEERLTGALVSMSLEHPPMVVFVQPGRAPAIGPSGQYEHVAQRLRNANIRVEQWNPSGQMSQFGQPTPPQPPPEADQGQKTIWIVLPFPPADPQNPMSLMAGGAKQQIADMLSERLTNGDAAMMILALEPGLQYGEGNPLLTMLEDWGVTAQLDRLVMRRVQLPDRQKINTIEFTVNRWPGDSPITRALSGMPGMFIYSCPIVIDEKKEGVTHEPLVVLRGQNMWANKDLTTAQDVQKMPIDEAERRDAFEVAVAAQREEQRMIVVTNPVWAMDRITTLGPLGPGSAELLGAVYPGNAELFVNGVYWLAGLDELIAASPRSQDIRRIAPMSEGELLGWRWALLAGMPAVVLCIGLGVWFVRRKG